MGEFLKDKVDYYYFHIDLSFETNRFQKAISQIMAEETYDVRKRSKNLTWLIRIAVFHYVTSIN